MIFLTNENDLSINKGIQALYFYAEWMPNHKKMITMISKVEEKYSDIKFTAIDTDYFKSVCKRFDIDSIPTVLVLSKSHQVKKINGIIMTSAFNSIFADIYNSEVKHGK
jgi:thioredoxin-like negative regulator of GroEL